MKTRKSIRAIYSKKGAWPEPTHNQSLDCDAGGGFTGVTTCGGSGVTVRSVVLASRLVHAGIATSMASQRMCMDPRTLLRLPISLCLQVLNCGFSLRRSHLVFKTFFGFAEGCVTSQRTFGAGKIKPGNYDQRCSEWYLPQHEPDRRRRNCSSFVRLVASSDNGTFVPFQR